jgi:dTDP-4-amino-4,6-dideoxygalactose transaminase/acetyltransferase-like isoleucine patch superfamily enzyme
MLLHVMTTDPRAPFVHPTAIVELSAMVGCGTAIWHHTHVRNGAIIGSNCTLGKNVYVDEGVLIGDRTKIQNNVSVYHGVHLGDEVFIGPSVVFTNDLRPRAMSNDWQPVPTHVRHGASIGANATIVCGVEIGKSGMVGAGAVVTTSVLPHELVMGNPALHRGWVCACGAVVSRAEQQPDELRCERCRGICDSAENPYSRGGRIRLAAVQLGDEDEQAVLRVLRSGHLAAGPWVEELEHSFARLHDSKHAVAVSNGTVALVAALRANQIGPGDEVITSPLTFVATLNSILEVGATVRFADITEDFTLDPSALTAMLSPRTRAVIPVHLYGLPASMHEIFDIADRHGLAVIEDAAQAHGARVGEKPVGSFGTGAFSLYATKNITCGEGGLVTTNDDQVAARLRLLRNHGMRDRYDYVMAGYNYRLTDIQAAIAVTQLKKLTGIITARNRNARRLSVGLAGVRGLGLPEAPTGRLHVWHQYTVRVGDDALIDRDQLVKALSAAGIDSMAYYPRLVHDYPYFRDHPKVICDRTPLALRAAGEVLSLPVHPALTTDDIDRVVFCVRGAFGQ